MRTATTHASLPRARPRSAPRTTSWPTCALRGWQTRTATRSNWLRSEKSRQSMTKTARQRDFLHEIVDERSERNRERRRIAKARQGTSSADLGDTDVTDV